jgi:phosphoribulokinase
MKFISIYGPEVAKDVIVRSMEDYNDYIAAKK